MNNELARLRNIITSFLMDILINILALVSYGVEVILRYEFGERYLSILKLIGMVAAVSLWLGIFDLGSAIARFGEFNFNPTIDMPTENKPFRKGFVYLVAFLGVCHLSEIYYRNARGILWHTQSSGISYLSWIIPYDRIVKLFIEPILVFTVATLITNFDQSLSLYLKVAAGTLLAKEYLINQKLRISYLDNIDAKIESRFFQDIIDQAWENFDRNKWPGPQKTQGFIVRMPLQPKTKQHFGKFKNIVAGLNPDLKDSSNSGQGNDKAKNNKDDDKGDNKSGEESG